MIRKVMGKLTLGIAVFCLALACGATEAPAQGSESKDSGWIEMIKKGDNGLYNKHGWNHYGPGHFALDRETGVLTGYGGMGLFWYGEQMFGDFVLEMEFKVDDRATNSGVFVRIPYVPTSNQYIYDCFEIQIYDAALDKDQEHVLHEGAEPRPGGPSPKQVTGAIYDAKPPVKLASKEAGEWNHYRFTLKGMTYKIELNGELVNEWTVEPAGKVATHWPKGYIGLQNHDDRHGQVHFRNIKAMPL
jgi:hypothetical protein